MINKQKIIEQKIMTPERLRLLINGWRLKEEKIVFTNGCFDLLHPGHIVSLAAAANYGQRLVVALNSDASVKKIKGSGRPFLNEVDRAMMIASQLVVDAVVVFEDKTPLKLIEQLEPDVLVKGEDYKEGEVIGAGFVKNRGGKVILIPLKEGYSTSSIIKKIQDAG